MLNENVNISQVSTKMHYNTDSWKSKDQTFILILEEARKNPIFKERSNSQELQWQHTTRKKATVWSNKNQTFTRSKKLWMMKFTSKDDLDFDSPQSVNILKHLRLCDTDKATVTQKWSFQCANALAPYALSKRQLLTHLITHT